MGFSRAIIKVCIFLLVEAGEFVCGVCLFSLFGLSVRSFQSLSWLGFLLALGIFPGHFSGAFGRSCFLPLWKGLTPATPPPPLANTQKDNQLF